MAWPANGLAAWATATTNSDEWMRMEKYGLAAEKIRPHAL